MTAVQTLSIIAAIVATGVGMTLWRRRSATWALQRALYPEIISMRFQAAALAVEIARRHNAGAPLDAAFFSQWRLSVPLVYPAVGRDLGLLPGDALDRVGYFHAQLAEARARLAQAQIDGGWPSSPYRMLSCLLRAQNHVEGWVKGLEPRLGRNLAGHLETTEADRLLEALEDATTEPIVLAYSWADCCVRR